MPDPLYTMYLNELRERCSELESIVRTIRKEQRLLEEHFGVELTTEKVYKKKDET
jgi:hypothetical protein